jgi:hypothetical protein
MHITSEFSVRIRSPLTFHVWLSRLTRTLENVPVSEDGFLQWQISSVMNKYNTTGNGFLLRLRDHHASDDKYLNGTAPTWTFNSERFFLKKSETSVENSSTTTSQTISSQTTSSQTTLQTTVSSTTPSAVVSSSATQASQTPPSLATEKSSSANNAGAIAAGVLGGLLGLALICGAILLLLRRKRGRNNSEDKVALPKSVNAEKAELGRSGSDSDITELDARDRVELDAYGRKPFELGAVSQAAELSADGKPTLYKSDGGRFVGCLRPSL